MIDDPPAAATLTSTGGALFAPGTVEAAALDHLLMIDVSQPADFAAWHAEWADDLGLPDDLAAAAQTAVTNPVYPWTTIVHISVDFKDGRPPGMGSGVMIGPNDVLTAAHVLYSPGRGLGEVSTVIPFFQAGNPSARYFGEALGSNWVPEGYKAQAPGFVANPLMTTGGAGYRGSEIDIGVITLDRNLGAFNTGTGYMILWPDYATGALHQSGYPHFYENDAVRYRDTILTDFVAEASMVPNENIINITKFETFGGNSGGPLWAMGTDGYAYVAGVVSTGGTKPDGSGRSGFGALAFDLDRYWVDFLVGYTATNRYTPA